MSDPFLAKIVRYGLAEADVAAFGNAYRATFEVGSHADIIDGGAKSKQIHILVKGWACKYRLMADGRRQILQIHLPGEICDLDKLCASDVAFGVLALTDCRVATISLDWLRRSVDERRPLRDLLWSLTVLENTMTSEHIVSLGRRSARERTAYFLCDLLERLEALGHVLDGGFRLPMTQVDMGDYLGLSTVHINRTLQDLKAEGLVGNSGRAYTIRDRDALKRVAGFAGRGTEGRQLLARCA